MRESIVADLKDAADQEHLEYIEPLGANNAPKSKLILTR